MAKSSTAAAADAYLDYFIDLCNAESVCTSEPTTRTEAHVTNMLATTTISAVSWTKAAGDAGGNSRKATIAQQSGVSMSNAGTALHVAIYNATLLLFVTTTPSKALTAGAGDTVDIGDWKVEVADPT